MSKNIVFEGWLTKSPPTKRIWRTKWRRRWFALRQSGELPGQYFLDYYADRNCRRLKGTINLDLCEQVDAGLHMERSSNGTLDPKLRGSVFTIQTQSRTYHLEAECEADMAKWVDAICRVCGLQAKEGSSNALDTYQNNYQMTTMNERIEGSETTGPYIPISECITGVRAQNSQRAFTFDPKNIVVSTRRQTDRVPNRNHQMYMSQPHIRPNNADVSENDSNLSEEECKSLNASQSNIREYSAARSYSKPAGRPNTDEDFQDGPPVPPRPPKTFAMSKDPSVNTLQPPKIIEPNDAPERFIPHPQPQQVICEQPRRRLNELPLPPRQPVISQQPRRRINELPLPPRQPVIYQQPRRRTNESNALLRVPGRMPSVGPPSPGRAQAVFTISRNDDDEECSGQSSMQYCNLVSLPPVVDRNLKPRYSSHSIGHVNNLGVQTVVQINRTKEVRSTVIQYLDLDLHTSDPPTSKGFPLIHGRSPSSLEARSAYKTVDFLKTEAFNITRQDAEASRSLHH